MECGRSTFCPRCQTYIDGTLECEPTMEVHNLKFCAYRLDAGPIQGGVSNATAYISGRRFILGNGRGDHVRGVRIIDSTHTNGSAAVDRPVSDPVESSDDGRPKIRIGPEYQAAIPRVSAYYKLYGTVTLDGIVVPMPLTEAQIETERDREIKFITDYPARNRIDKPRKRPPPVPVPVPATTKIGRTVNPVKHFKPQ